MQRAPKPPRKRLDQAKVERIADYYETAQPNVRLLKLVLGAGELLLRDELYFEHKDTQAKLLQAKEAGKQFIWAASHQKFGDPFVLSKILKSMSGFERYRFEMPVMASANLHLNPVYGPIVRNSGVAVPVYRKKNYPEATSDEIKAANNTQKRIFVSRLNQGRSIAIWPGGTRGHELGEVTPTGERQPRDYSSMLEVQRGIGEIACAVNNPENILIVPIGTIFGKNNKHNFHPVSVVGDPHGVADTPDLVVAQTKDRLAVVLGLAADLALAA